MLKKILVAGFMVAAKDVICCKHIARVILLVIG